MIVKYINIIARLEKREGKLGTMIGIVLSIIMLLIGIMITIFGLHLMSKASIRYIVWVKMQKFIVRNIKRRKAMENKYQCFFTENQIKVMKMTIEKVHEEGYSYSYNGTDTDEVLNLLNNVLNNIKNER